MPSQVGWQPCAALALVAVELLVSDVPLAAPWCLWPLWATSATAVATGASDGSSHAGGVALTLAFAMLLCFTLASFWFMCAPPNCLGSAAS